MSKVSIIRCGIGYPLSVHDMEDGNAYESEQGCVVICNKIENLQGTTLETKIIAFSVDGSTFFTSKSISNFRAVNLKVQVES